MGHIELIGCPGAGKTSVCTSLTSSDRWYGPTPEEASRRKFLDTGKLKYRPCYHALPSSLQSVLDEELLAYRYEARARRRFGEQHPDALRRLFAGICTVEHQPEKLKRLVERTIGHYQLGTETVHEDETLCLDEGFGMMAVSTLWRRPSSRFSLKEYLRHVPTPEVLVYLRAPPETCLDRQRKRGRMGVSEPWISEDLEAEQIRFTELCEKVVDEQRSNTTVLTIDNTDSTEDAVGRIGRSLADALSVDGSTFIPGGCVR